MAYLPLSTANLPDPVIDPAQGSSPEDYFNTVLYTGTGVSGNSQDVGWQPDLLWMKPRDQARDHRLIDVLRGNAVLSSNDTDAEIAGGDMIVNSTGFEFTSGSSNYNGSTNTYVAWNWKANGSGVSNTDGSITSTVSANTESGFSIVSYTGTAASATIGHGLGVKPSMIIVKKRTDASPGNARGWAVWHQSLATDKVLQLNSNAGQSTEANFFIEGNINSTVFGVGADYDTGWSDSYIAYCFHSVEGFSKFGTYFGNNSTNGPFVYTGFRPAFLMVKAYNTSASWVIRDTKRDDGINDGNITPFMYADATTAESTLSTSGRHIDFLSNGFKVRENLAITNLTNSFIYMAFAENPFKYSNAR